MSKLLFKKIVYSKAIILRYIILKHKNYNLLLLLTPFGIGLKKIPKQITLLINPLLSNNNITLINNQNSLLKKNNKFFGLYWNLIKNFVQDYTKIFYSEIELRGMGYKGFIKKINQKQQLFQFNIGYTHLLYYTLPKFFFIKYSKFKLNKAKRFFIFGNVRQKVSEIIYYLKSLKPVDSYKGKGVFFINEVIKLKEGKKQK